MGDDDGMSYLLLPGDERLLVAHLCDGLGWQLVSGRMTRGRPEPIVPWSAALTDELPTAGDMHSGPLWVFMFWSANWGTAVSIQDAPALAPVDHVRRVLRQQAGVEAGALDDVIDPHFSPVAFYRRCYWDGEGDIGLGFLRGMDRPRRDWPPSLRRSIGQAERWLKRESVKVNPFDHVTASRGIDGVTTWVMPAAWAWLQDGGHISSATGF